MRHKFLLIIFLILGILIGFIVGGVIVSRQYDRMLFSFFKRNDDVSTLNKDTIINQHKNNFAKAQTKAQINSSVANASERKYIIYSDTLAIDSSSLNSVDNQEIIVKKDVLLKALKLYIYNALSADKRKKDNYLDSLLIDDHYSNKSQDIMVVEFWQSPVNYKGYKMSRTKLVLFGLEPLDNMMLKYIDGTMYLKYGIKYFKLSYSDEFQPYQLILND
ncbi:MAG: hypothetical protein WCK02_10675 [Bacteroidota bacterium]